MNVDVTVTEDDTLGYYETREYPIHYTITIQVGHYKEDEIRSTVSIGGLFMDLYVLHVRSHTEGQPDGHIDVEWYLPQPVDVNNVKATLGNGVLDIMLPKLTPAELFE